MARNIDVPVYEDVKTWGTENVSDWLHQIGFYEFVNGFQDKGIDGKHLLNLSADELRRCYPNMRSSGRRADPSEELMKRIQQVKSNKKKSFLSSMTSNFNKRNQQRDQTPVPRTPDYPSKTNGHPQYQDNEDAWPDDEFEDEYDDPTPEPHHPRSSSYHGSTGTTASSTTTGDSEQYYQEPGADDDFGGTYEVPGQEPGMGMEEDFDQTYDVVPHEDDVVQTTPVGRHPMSIPTPQIQTRSPSPIGSLGNHGNPANPPPRPAKNLNLQRNCPAQRDLPNVPSLQRPPKPTPGHARMPPSTWGQRTNGEPHSDSDEDGEDYLTPTNGEPELYEVADSQPQRPGYHLPPPHEEKRVSQQSFPPPPDEDDLYLAPDVTDNSEQDYPIPQQEEAIPPPPDFPAPPPPTNQGLSSPKIVRPKKAPPAPPKDNRISIQNKQSIPLPPVPSEDHMFPPPPSPDQLFPPPLSPDQLDGVAPPEEQEMYITPLEDGVSPPEEQELYITPLEDQSLEQDDLYLDPNEPDEPSSRQIQCRELPKPPQARPPMPTPHDTPPMPERPPKPKSELKNINGNLPPPPVIPTRPLVKSPSNRPPMPTKVLQNPGLSRKISPVEESKPLSSQEDNLHTPQSDLGDRKPSGGSSLVSDLKMRFTNNSLSDNNPIPPRSSRPGKSFNSQHHVERPMPDLPVPTRPRQKSSSSIENVPPGITSSKPPSRKRIQDPEKLKPPPIPTPTKPAEVSRSPKKEPPAVKSSSGPPRPKPRHPAPAQIVTPPEPPQQTSPPSTPKPPPSPTPTPRHVPKHDELDGYPWYHRDIKRNKAFKAVEDCRQDGAFLVRPSERGGTETPYSLTLWYNNKVRNLKIRKRPDGKFALGNYKDNEVTHDNAATMIQYYQQEPVILARDEGNVVLRIAVPVYN